ncbi:hypothetical protein [Tabrizicola sp.]|uniref:hypothetical protein n=1 Tax=Tabrizicola sp. TaxID=2005166 RepID=UPI002FDCF67A
MKYIGLLLVLIGAGVFTLPMWLPSVADVSVTGETFTRAGQVGGAVAGVGLVLFVIGLFRRR